jgi:hypothetical protein
MRAWLAPFAAIAVVAAVAAVTPDPQRILFARVGPGSGQLGVFIAAADGSPDGERVAFVSPAAASCHRRTRARMRFGFDGVVLIFREA